jgi:hypothetical protein
MTFLDGVIMGFTLGALFMGSLWWVSLNAIIKPLQRRSAMQRHPSVGGHVRVLGAGPYDQDQEEPW